MKLRVRTAAALAVVTALQGSPARPQPAEPAAPLTGTHIDVDVHGNVFILDAEAFTLTQYDAAFKRVAETGGPGWEQGRFDRPAGLWARNGLDVFVADFGNHRVQRFDRTLSFVSLLETRESGSAGERFGFPRDVALSRLGTLYICDSENKQMVRVDAANRVTATFGGIGAGHGRLRDPSQVETGPHDWVYVLDEPDVVVFDSFGNYLTTLPQAQAAGPMLLVADERGALVFDRSSMVWFDETHRPVLTCSLATLLGSPDPELRAACVAGGRLYALTHAGVFVLPDPRGQ